MILVVVPWIIAAVYICLNGKMLPLYAETLRSFEVSDQHIHCHYHCYYQSIKLVGKGILTTL
jgi:hypothetical protein